MRSIIKRLPALFSIFVGNKAVRMQTANKGLLRAFWQSIFKTDFSFMIITFIILGVIRVVGLAGYGLNLTVLGFLIMWIMPIIFLDKEGRRKIGIKKPESWSSLFLSFFIGIVAAASIYYLGYLLYGYGIENWGMSIVSEYADQGGDVFNPVVFASITFFTMLFSPIGEELYFRGIIQEILANKTGSYKSAVFLSSLSFAIIHLPHHKLFFQRQNLTNSFIPLFLWTVFMFLVSYLFMYAREKTDSIWGAILCHSGYILGMKLIVYFILL